MEAKEFWNLVDKKLSQRGISLIELAHSVGMAKATIYKQRDKMILPKGEHFQKILSQLNINLDSNNNKFSEYVYYLERAEEWQLKAIREILHMPEEKNLSSKVG